MRVLQLRAGLVAAVFIQVRIGLQPLFALRTEIADVRKGKATRIEGDYPLEIAPLAGGGWRISARLPLEDLAEHRRQALEALAESSEANQSEGQGADDSPATLAPPHPAVLDPTLWWRYDAALDGDLVVITPAMDGDTGLDAAGELPLAEEPRFPEAKQHFLTHLREQGQTLAQQAMLAAMAAGG